MSIIGIDDQYEQRALGQFIDAPKPYEPTAFEGVAQAIGNAPMRLAAKSALAVGMAGSGLAWWADKEFGNAMFARTEKLYGKASDYWTPDARTTGQAAQIVGSVAEVIPALFLGPGAAPVLAGTATASTGRDLAQEGVDGATAGVVAGVQGLAIAAGVAAPAAIGKTLAQRVASGAAINTATGAASDLVSNVALASGGYDKQAERFNPFDLTARGIDALMGAAFGAAAHIGAPKEFDQQLDAADKEALLSVANQNHLVNATGPGRPATQADAGKQSRNVTSAIDQLLDTGRVDAGQLPEDDIAFRHEQPLVEPSAMREGVEDGLREAGALDDSAEIPRDPTADIVADVIPIGDVPTAVMTDASRTEPAGPIRLADDPAVADTLTALENDKELAAFRIEDENGNHVPLADVVRGAVSESEQAAELRPGFKAAALCFLRSLA